MNVKDEVVTSETAKVSAETTKVEETKEEVIEDESKRTIPYSRFKEMVDTKKELEKQVKKMEQLVDQKVRETQSQYQAHYEGELAKMNRALQEQNLYTNVEDPTVKAYEQKVGTLAQQLDSMKSMMENLRVESETSKLQTQLTKLKDVYPELDEEHTYALKKLKPEWSLDECAEYSHNKWSDKFKTGMAKLIAQKKEAAKATVITGDSRPSLKPEKAPTSFAEARKGFREYLHKIGVE